MNDRYAIHRFSLFSCNEAQAEPPANGELPREQMKAGDAKPGSRPGVLLYALWSCFAVVLLGISLLHWGGYLLVADDHLPARVDAAVTLQGSILGEEARVAGAVRLLQQGTTAKLLLSVPKESYWGRPIAPIAYAYIEKTYGQEVASRIDFCETGDIDSTEEEAETVASCVDQRGWSSIAVVTSDYHTRRAGIIWRRTLRQQHSPVHLWVHGVADPDFHASGWWRERRSAKTWIMESMKLMWTLAGR